MLCGALILLAMLFDADRRPGRPHHPRDVSDFGAQLDSLCDFVSFGLAPAILLVKMCPQFTSSIATRSGASRPCSPAARPPAGRFNVESDSDDDHTMFAGLPTPAAAATIGSFAILSYSLRNEAAVVTNDNFRSLRLVDAAHCTAFCRFIAVLMVSRIPYPHPLTQFVRGQRSFAQLVAIVFSLMVILIVRNYAIPLLCVAFVLTPPVKYLWNLAWHRQAQENESLF